MDCRWLPEVLIFLFQLTENLAVGTGPFTVTDGINMWTGEAGDYDPNNPQYSHFTQVVWKDTTSVGCVNPICPPGTVFPDRVRLSPLLSIDLTREFRVGV